MRWFGDVLNQGPKRDGFLGIGGSGSSTDRGQNLGATQGSWNIFNYGLPTGQSQQTSGQNTLQTAQANLQPASQYWQSLLTGGRTQYAGMAAPQINSTLAGADATRTQAAQFGSGRSGGAVSQQRDAATGTQKQIDDTLNTNIVQGRQAGAQGATQVAAADTAIGGVQLQNALAQLGLSQTAIEDIMKNSSTNYQFDSQQESQTAAAAGTAAAKLAPSVAAWFGL
jgi:hypothetical protein